MGDTPIQQVRTLLEAANLAEQPQDVAGTRARMEETTGAFPVPEDVRVEPVKAGGVPAEWVRAPGADDTRAILYLHGGGYVIGSPRTHRALTARLSEAARAPVLAIDYRLAPEHPHPAALDDALAAWRWLLGEGGYEAARLAVSGDSAGGGLTMALLLAARDAGLPMPASAAPISPWVDLTGESESATALADKDPIVTQEGLREMAAHYAGGGDIRAPLISPVFEKNLKGLPPLLIHVGSDEVLLDDSRTLAKNAKASGVDTTLEVWDEMIHVWHLFHFMLPEGGQALDKIGTFFLKHWGAEKSRPVHASAEMSAGQG